MTATTPNPAARQAAARRFLAATRAMARPMAISAAVGFTAKPRPSSVPAAAPRRAPGVTTGPFWMTGKSTARPPMLNATASPSTWLPATSTCSSSGLQVHSSAARSRAGRPGVRAAREPVQQHPGHDERGGAHQVEREHRQPRGEPARQRRGAEHPGRERPVHRRRARPVLHRPRDRIAGQRPRRDQVGVVPCHQFVAVGGVREKIRCPERPRGSHRDCRYHPGEQHGPRADRPARSHRAQREQQAEGAGGQARGGESDREVRAEAQVKAPGQPAGGAGQRRRHQRGPRGADRDRARDADRDGREAARPVRATRPRVLTGGWRAPRRRRRTGGHGAAAPAGRCRSPGARGPPRPR